MDAPNRSLRRSVMILVALASILLGIWVSLDGRPNAIEDSRRPAVAEAEPEAETKALEPTPTAGYVPGSPIRIGENGRQTLEAGSLPEHGPLSLVLALSDELRGQGAHAVRIVSVDGRKLEALAEPRSGAGSGVQVEIDAEFLKRGRYLIEIDTDEKHPLQFRRYVLELN